MSESQTVETMPVDQPSQPESDIWLHPGSHDETRIQGLDTSAEGTAIHRRKTGTPDSTTDLSLACDTNEEGPGTPESMIHTRTDQAEIEDSLVFIATLNRMIRRMWLLT